MSLTPELAALYNQLLGDREAIADAREKLARAEAAYWQTSERIRKALDTNPQKVVRLHDPLTVARKVAEAIARIGKEPPREYQPPRLSEHDAEQQHYQEQARKLK